MRDVVDDVLDQLLASRSPEWLRIIGEARLGDPVTPDADAAQTVEPYRWLIERVEGGVALTQAGYLPPVVVSEAMAALGWHDRWIGKGNREDLTIPVLHLRFSAQELGLLRKYKGRLLPSRLGRTFIADPLELWWALAATLPTGESVPHQHAGVLALLQTAAGRSLDNRLLADGLWALGWAHGENHQRLTPSMAYEAARGTIEMLDRLGLRPHRRRFSEPELPPSPSAVVFARAALAGRPAGGTVTPSAEIVTTTAPAVELTVTLRDIEPPIWRRLVVPTALTLRQTHEVVQTAMGWFDDHLHMFDVGGTLYGDIDDFDGPLGDEGTFTLADVLRAGPAFTYEYDFGDSWTHDLVLGDVSDGPAGPRLVDGARACPPEDCGGPRGYEHLLEVLADPTHDEYPDLLEWTGGGFDPEAFDLDAKNLLLELFARRPRRR